MPIPSRSLSRRPFFVAVAALGLLSSQCTPNPASTADAATDARDELQCQSFFFVPPTVAVTNAATGDPLCDGVTFTVVAGPQGIPATPFAVDAVLCTDTNQIGGCPAPGADAAAGCVFALLGLSRYATGPMSHAFTIAVAHPGFSSATVDVTTGYGGCFGAAPASSESAALTPVAVDAGADGD